MENVSLINNVSKKNVIAERNTFITWQIEALQHRQVSDLIDCFVASFEPTGNTARKISRGMVKLSDCIRFVVNNSYAATIKKRNLKDVILLKVTFTNDAGNKTVYNFNAGNLNPDKVKSNKNLDLARPFVEEN